MADSPPDSQRPSTCAVPEDEARFYLDLMRAYFDSANDAIFVLCDEQKFLAANRTMEEWLGESEGKLTAHNRRLPIAEFFGIKQAQEVFQRNFPSVLAGERRRFECLIHPPKGFPRWVEISMNRVGVESGDMVIAVARDITEQKTVMLRMEQQALRDDLTGLVNRRGFMQQLDQAVRSAHMENRHHTLICVDFDQFKVVNDTLGHSAGDDLLRQAAMLMKGHARGRNVVARLGGDEFALLLWDCGAAEALQAARELQQVVMSPRFSWDGRLIDLSASMGVACIDAATPDTMAALAQADAACYAAKDTGRGHVQLYFGGAPGTEKRREMDWVSRIQDALRNDRFCLYAQRIVPIGEGDLNEPHEEILVRMLDADGRVIAPQKFLPAAVRYGLMAAIDRWVIRHTFAAKAAAWGQGDGSSASGASFTAINLSGASLNDETFLDFLVEQVGSHVVPPGAVCFEITETVALRDLTRVASFISQLKKLGFLFALDDFGSGVSSFSYLKSLPVDFVKIDGALVREIEHSVLDLRIVESVVYVAREMGVRTIAEYVENPGILAQLERIGVSYAQGYAIHQPQPLASLAARVH